MVTISGEGRTRTSEGLAWHLPVGQPGSLLVERLVAEVVGPGFEVVLSSHSLVVPDKEGNGPGHQGAGSPHDEDQVAGSQARPCRQR